MIPLGTVKLLRAWAAWGHGQNLDYPSMSPMFGERALKTPLYGIDHAPADILEMEAAVCRLEFADRDIIIQRWQRRRTFRQMAEYLGVSRWTIGRRIRQAESEVHRQLEENSLLFAPHMLSVVKTR
jgi:DNA-directed RNA polymerase specialized sigma subunit